MTPVVPFDQCTGSTGNHDAVDVRITTVMDATGAFPVQDTAMCRGCREAWGLSGQIVRAGRSVDEPVLRERRAGWTLQRRVRDTGIENRRNWKGSGIRQRASDFVRRHAA